MIGKAASLFWIWMLAPPGRRLLRQPGRHLKTGPIHCPVDESQGIGSSAHIKGQSTACSAGRQLGGPVDSLANPTRVVRSLRAHRLDCFERHVITPVPLGYPGEGRCVYPASRQLTTMR